MEVLMMIMLDTSKISITNTFHHLSSRQLLHNSSFFLPFIIFSNSLFFCEIYGTYFLHEMHNSHSFIAQENRGVIEIDIVKSLTLRFHEVSRVVSSLAAETRQDLEEADEEEILIFDQYEADLKVHDDGEGFRTPTRTENKIPEPKKCPPPPRKPNLLFSFRKRKSRTFVKLDFSEDVGSMYPSVINSDFDRKVKKAKKGGDHPSVHPADRS